MAQLLQAQSGAQGQRGVRVLALTSSPEKVPALRRLGVQPLLGNLDDARSLRRLQGLAHYVVHWAPPQASGVQDLRTAALLPVLARGRAPRSLVYASTSGVYGDCQGQWIDETRALQPATDRARRRVDAEQRVRTWGLQTGVRVSVLRIPGIYAPDREGGTPQARLRKGLPVLCAPDDVYTNHIHADDLARAGWAALWRGQAQRSYNICDDSELRMGDYFDMAADLYGLPRPPRCSRTDIAEHLSAAMLSFMGESRRLRNARMRQELRVRLQWPTAQQGLAGSD